MQDLPPDQAAPRTRFTAALDAGAMLISGLCLVHCLALPVLLALLPFAAASFVADESFHRWLLLAIVPTSALALVIGSRRHRHASVLRLGAGAVALLAVAAFGDLYGMSERWQTVLTVTGGLLLATAHLTNLRLHRQGHEGHSHPATVVDTATP
jgi:hypothetical protein